MLSAYREAYNYRDKRMFENIQWIVEQEESLGRGKVFVFGHNQHISKQMTLGRHLMGMHLAAEYGESYFAIGTDLLNGTFIAWQPDSGLKRFAMKNEASELNDSFAQMSMPTCVIHTNDYAEYGEEMATILTGFQPMVSIGLTFDKQYVDASESFTLPIIPISAYDAIIFVRDSTPATIVRPQAFIRG